MYVHLGEDTAVYIRDIIAVIDLDNTTTSKITRDFFSAMQKRGNIVNVTEELPKSAVVCKDKVYISQLAPGTLQRRMCN